jgi:rare lipoprotein A
MITSKTFRVCAMAAAGLAVSEAPAMAQCGTASWYHEGARTATGERYNPDGVTAAHRSLPFGTRVKVTHKRTGRSVVVRINDRGPFIRGRIIDLSRGAKRVIGMGGLAPVCLTVLGRGEGYVSAERPRKKAQRSGRKNGISVVNAYGATETGVRWSGERAELRKRGHAEKYAGLREAPRVQRPAKHAAVTGSRSSFKVVGWPGSTDTAF